MTPDLATLQRTAEAAGLRCVAAGVIVDEARRALVLRRAPSARHLPGLWDIAGGHVEPGESVEQALRREVIEETGWTVVGEPSLVFLCDWQLAPGKPRREFDFLVSVAGDLAGPRLSPAEHVRHRWITREEIALFNENEGADDGLLRRIVSAAFNRCGTGRLESPHATIFLGDSGRDIELLRQRWDPVMAAQIPAHVPWRIRRRRQTSRTCTPASAPLSAQPRRSNWNWAQWSTMAIPGTVSSSRSMTYRAVGESCAHRSPVQLWIR